MGNTPTTKFNKKTTAEEAADSISLTGKTVIITGCNTGIGKETVRVLAIRGAKVYMACRNIDKANTARQHLIKTIQSSDNKDFDGSQLIVLPLDLSSLLSVRRFVSKYLSFNEGIDYLILNAGIMNTPQFTASRDGYELQFATNHLGHFYLTLLLTPLLTKYAPSRVIVVASNASVSAPNLENKEKNFITDGIQRKDGPMWLGSSLGMKGYPNYAVSKACNILFAREYHRRYSKNGVIAVSLHPGVIYTELGRYSSGMVQFIFSKTAAFQKSIPQGAATTVRCVSLENGAISGGHYYKDCQEANESLRKDLRPNKLYEKKSEDERDKNDVKSDVMDKDQKEDDDNTDKKDDKVSKEESVEEIKGIEEEEKEEIKEDNKDSTEYKLWQWSELLITSKGFKLDMVGFEEEEKERQIKEEKEGNERIEKEKQEAGDKSSIYNNETKEKKEIQKQSEEDIDEDNAQKAE